VRIIRSGARGSDLSKVAKERSCAVVSQLLSGVRRQAKVRRERAMSRVMKGRNFTSARLGISFDRGLFIARHYMVMELKDIG
jgi:hypothetical protein